MTLGTLHSALRSMALATSAIVLTASCNERTSIFESAVAPTPTLTTTGPSVPAPVSTLFGFAFDPRAIAAGQSSRGTAILTLPAPPGGTVVALSSSDSRVAVPPSVVIPAGAEAADFVVSTGLMANDTDALIAGSVPGRSVTAVLPVWADLPTSFSWFSDPGDSIGGGEYGRLIATTAIISATASAGLVRANINRGNVEFWSLEFSSPRNTALVPGVYEDAMRSAFRDNTRPGLDISGRSRGCNTVSGRFEVLELVWRPDGAVTRFRATFEQHCGGVSAALRGEFRFVAGSR